MLNTIHKVTGVKIKPNDSKRLLYICIVLFLLLTSNGILSPIRDTLGSMQGKDVVSYLVSMSTFSMIAINPLTSYIANNCTTLLMGKIYIRGAGGQNDNVGFTTFSQGIDIDDAAASQKWTIVNNSANTCLSVNIERSVINNVSFG